MHKIVLTTFTHFRFAFVGLLFALAVNTTPLGMLQKAMKKLR